MEWTRSETLALAASKCAICHGIGLKPSWGSSVAPCKCVFRSIFRTCYNRFRECVEKEKHLSHAVLEFNARFNRRITWGRKDEEYIADFYLVSKRALTEEEFRVFNYHFLLGADWRLCCRKLKIDRGTFFHAVYRVEQKLGQTYRELEPYPLFPLDEYFHGTTRAVQRPTAKVVSIAPEPTRLSSRIPLRKIA